MSKSFGPKWDRALYLTNWAAHINARTAPAALSRRGQRSAPGSLPRAAYSGAAAATNLIESSTIWVGHGTLLAAKYLGAPISPTALAITAYPVARLLVGDGLDRSAEGYVGTTHNAAKAGAKRKTDKPARNWATVKSAGLLGLPEALLLACAAGKTAHNKQWLQRSLLAVALGLRCIIQVPRAVVGLVGVTAALLGAGVSVSYRLVKLAYAVAHGNVDEPPSALQEAESTVKFQLQFIGLVKASFKVPQLGVDAARALARSAKTSLVRLDRLTHLPQSLQDVLMPNAKAELRYAALNLDSWNDDASAYDKAIWRSRYAKAVAYEWFAAAAQSGQYAAQGAYAAAWAPAAWAYGFTCTSKTIIEDTLAFQSRIDWYLDKVQSASARVIATTKALAAQDIKLNLL